MTTQRQRIGLIGSLSILAFTLFYVNLSNDYEIPIRDATSWYRTVTSGQRYPSNQTVRNGNGRNGALLSTDWVSRVEFSVDADMRNFRSTGSPVTSSEKTQKKAAPRVEDKHVSAGDISEIVTRTIDIDSAVLSLEIDENSERSQIPIYEHIADLYLSPQQCSPGNSPDFIRLVPSQLGAAAIAALDSSLRRDSHSATREVARISDPRLQLLLLEGVSRDARASSPLVSKLRVEDAEKIRSEIATLASEIKTDPGGMIAGNIRVHRAGEDESAAREKYEQIQRNVSRHAQLWTDLIRDAALLATWIRTSFSSQSDNSVSLAALDLYDLALNTDNWTASHEFDFARIPTPSYYEVDRPNSRKLRSLVLPLSYALSYDGNQWFSAFAINRIHSTRYQVKAMLTFCMLRGLLDSKKYAEAISVIKGLRVPAEATLLRSGTAGVRFDLRSASDCTRNTIFGSACELFLAIANSNDKKMQDLAKRSFIRKQFAELVGDMNAFYAKAVDDLCISIASDSSLNMRWSDILVYLNGALGPTASEQASRYKATH